MSTASIAKPHKHAEIIKAWADGATIECLSPLGSWVESPFPAWDCRTQYRVKPERAYPESRMTYEDFARALQGRVDKRIPTAIANAALRHAIDAGQLIEPANKYLAKRDLAIATAVREACRNNFRNHGVVTEATAYGRISNVSLEGIIAQVKP